MRIAWPLVPVLGVVVGVLLSWQRDYPWQLTLAMSVAFGTLGLLAIRAIAQLKRDLGPRYMIDREDETDVRDE